MKRSLASVAVLACMLMCAQLAVAQEEGYTYRLDKGHWSLSGSTTFGFESQSGDLYENSAGDAQTNIGLSTGVGYFVTRGLNIGAMVGFESEKQGKFSSSTFGIGPQLNYMFVGDGRWVPYIGGAFLFSSYSADNGISESKATLTSIILQGGVQYMLTPSAALGIGLQYKIDSYKMDGVDKSVSGNVLRIGANINIFI